ncbi:MAG TPA: MBL fold metallo-hydrolase [Mycobacteriales bacterium]|nr:MBL fold metallo-hydrolase [Mycobacteriales bacterium]
MTAYGVLRPVNPVAGVLLAHNPSPMTLDGTNSWVLRAPGERSCIVVDPGPDDAAHLDALAAAGPVALILLTHRHADHTAGIPGLHSRTGAPVRAADPEFCVAAEPLRDGESIAAAGLELRVLATPGHTTDSVSFVRPDAVLTGDTILGRGTTVVAHPDGRLGPYLASLRRLAELGARAVLPGHGPDRPDLSAVAAEYLEHRMRRLDQVRAVAGSPAEIVRQVYADVDPALWPAAELSVRAQLEYLRDSRVRPVPSKGEHPDQQ